MVPLPESNISAGLKTPAPAHRAAILTLENLVRLRQPLFYISSDKYPWFPLNIPIREELRSRGFHRLFRIEDKREHLILHRDQLQCLVRCLRVHRGHCRHCLPSKSNPIVDDVLTINRHLRRVLVRDHCLHASQRLGLAGVDADNPGVRMRASQHPGHQHPGQFDISSVFRAARNPIIRVQIRRTLANNL